MTDTLRRAILAAPNINLRPSRGDLLGVRAVHSWCGAGTHLGSILAKSDVTDLLRGSSGALAARSLAFAQPSGYWV
jgi:hypothetical protein